MSSKKRDTLDRKQLLLRLENNKRYGHTATSNYKISMATLQPDAVRQPNCLCSVINKDHKLLNRVCGSEDNSKVTIIVEHNLKEHILCVLDSQTTTQCKLNLDIQAGEQIAFRTLGRTPALLTGKMYN